MPNSTAMMTSKSLPLQFRKDLDKMFSMAFMEEPYMMSKVFKVRTADKGAYYSRAEIAGLGMPERIVEGAGVPYDTTKEGFEKNRRYEVFGLGYTITDLMWKDERYGMIKQLPTKLARSMKIWIDLDAFRRFNEGSTGTADYAKAKDGLNIFADHALLNAHPDVTNQTSVNNKSATQGDLSETTFAVALEYYRDMVDEDGYPIMMTPSMLLTSSDDVWLAHRLHTQQYGSTYDQAGLFPANEDKSGSLNLANPSNGFINGWQPMSTRWIDPDKWFVMSNDHDMGFYWKEQPTQVSETEFDTGNVKYKATMRYGAWCDEYRGLYGNLA